MSKDIKDEEIRKYIPIHEITKILDAGNITVENLRNNLKRLGIRRIKLRVNGEYHYHIEDTYDVFDKAKEFFDNHYTYEEVLKLKGMNRKKIRKSNITKVAVPPGYSIIFSNTRFQNKDYKISHTALNKNEFHIIFGKISEFPLKDELTYSEIEKYVSFNEAIKLLGLDDFSNDIAINSISSLNIRKVTKGRRLYFHIEDITNIISEVESFFENHYTYSKTLEILKSKTLHRKLPQVVIPSGYNAILFKKRFPNQEYTVNKIAYNKVEVDNFKNQKQLKNLGSAFSMNGVEYLPLDQALQLLNFSKSYFVTVIKKSYNIRTITTSDAQILYSKDDIVDLLKKQQNFYLEYADRNTINEKYFDSKSGSNHLLRLKRYDIPPYANIKGLRQYVFKISEVEEYVENLRKTTINTDIQGNSPFKTFKIRLESYGNWGCFDESSKYTEQKWFEFIKSRLRKSKSSEKLIHTNISKYIKCTVLIKEMLERNDKSEIYLLTSSEINLYLKSIEVLNHKKIIYLFIQEVYSDLVATGNLKNRFFKLSEIKKPPRLSTPKETLTEDTDDVIYDFAVYSQVFKYQTSINLHVKKSIEEIKAKGTATYASAWLYTMLHLNNAWRHGDVREFPKLEIEDLLANNNINSVEWFKSNKIDLPLARAIIYRIIQWEFIISKTQIKGRFFCSDELAPSIATSIIILTLFNNSLILDPSDKLMKFNTKFNEVNSSLLKRFFKELNVTDFIFSSKKFNKSIMTYITYLANMSGDEKAMEYAKALRGHKRLGSTLYYIDFNIEEVEKLSKMLFARGEFGYVASMLMNKLFIGANFKEVTEQVYAVNKLFGETNKINTTIAFLNNVRTDREVVSNYLTTLSFKECQEKLTDLFAKNLPSKQGSEIQCLHSKTGCQRTDLEDCFECPFHIPSIYALSTLCDGLTHDIELYNEANNKARKFKLSIKINRKKKVLIEAIQTFGKDYVYGCLGMPRDKFLDKLAMVENPLINK